MYKFKRRLEEISEGIEKSKFPSVTKSKFLQEIIQTIIRRSNGDSMQKVVSKLEVKDKEIGDNLLTAFERMKYLENDPEFKLVKELKYSKSYKKEIKGEPVIYKCQGEVPIPLIDLLAFLADDNETKSWYDNLFVKEELLRKIHPDIQIIRQAYKATWPTAPRDFIMGSWIHLTQEGHAYIIATSCQDPLGPKVRGYVRGQVIVCYSVYIYIVWWMDTQTYYI